MIHRLIDRYFIKKPKFRRFVTKLLFGESDQAINLLGTPLLVHSLKENGYLRAHRIGQKHSVYKNEALVLMNLALLVQPQDTFLDVGANIGVYCCTLARRSAMTKQPGQTLAFEANPDTYGRLKENAKSLPIECHNMAISKEAGTLEFVAGAVSHVFTTTQHANSYNIRQETQTVSCQRLDSFDIRGNSIVMKIDVEGQELDVLLGAEGFLAARRVKAIYIDGFADPKLPGHLRDRGFRLLDGKTLLPFAENGFNLLAMRDV